jgi:hypothetical protein
MRTPFHITVIVALFPIVINAASPEAVGVKLYDPDPSHLWNRLHQTLFVRTTADGTVFGRDSLDPPLFAETNFLLKGPSRPKALAVLDEFLNTHGEKLIDDPLKSAILQRDLWFAFDWAYKGDFSRAHDELSPARQALQTRLARVISRLALKPSQIAALPDNYAAAIKSGRFPTAYDPARPAQAFLPDDLLSPNGPWVAVISGDTFAAKFHVNDFGGRYAFDLFINLPGGRAATLAYLQHPWPALPRGTQLVLLRRPLLIDTEGKLHSTSMVESLQMRVFRAIPRAAVPLSANSLKDDGETDVFEIVRSRAAIFAGDAGGLRAVTPDEKGLPSPIRAHLADLIQMTDHPMPGNRPKPIKEAMRPVLNQCLGCHTSGRLETAYAHLVPLEKSIFDIGANAVVTWKTQQKDWKELIALMQR